MKSMRKNRAKTIRLMAMSRTFLKLSIVTVIIRKNAFLVRMMRHQMASQPQKLCLPRLIQRNMVILSVKTGRQRQKTHYLKRIWARLQMMSPLPREQKCRLTPQAHCMALRRSNLSAGMKFLREVFLLRLICWDLIRM